MRRKTYVCDILAPAFPPFPAGAGERRDCDNAVKLNSLTFPVGDRRAVPFATVAVSMGVQERRFLALAVISPASP